MYKCLHSLTVHIDVAIALPYQAFRNPKDVPQTDAKADVLKHLWRTSALEKHATVVQLYSVGIFLVDVVFKGIFFEFI